jgi:hypothetical protein
VKHWFFVLFLAGCAQVGNGDGQTNATTSTGGVTGIGGHDDLSVVAPSGDLAGLDLAMSGGNLPDFAGHDLATSSSDMATVCDPVKQTGCGAGLKCGLESAPECQTNGTVDTGAVCGAGSSDDCKAGNICSSVNSSVTTCHQFCTGESDCKQPPVGPAANVGHCIVQLTGTPYSFCTVPCDPVNATANCAGGLACTIGATMTINEITSCETVGTKTDTQACSSINDCAPGYTCTSINGAAASCRRVCAAPADCLGVGPGGYSCHINTGDHWGICA